MRIYWTPLLIAMVTTACTPTFKLNGEVINPKGCDQGLHRGVDCFNTLSQIHSNVLNRFIYTSDQQQYGTSDYWMSPDQLGGIIKGDCEDFALAARKLCRTLGIQSRLVFVKTEQNYHVVLSVNQWILDNINDDVVLKTALDYRWLAISGYEKGQPWRMIIND